MDTSRAKSMSDAALDLARLCMAGIDGHYAASYFAADKFNFIAVMDTCRMEFKQRKAAADKIGSVIKMTLEDHQPMHMLGNDGISIADHIDLHNWMNAFAHEFERPVFHQLCLRTIGKDLYLVNQFNIYDPNSTDARVILDVETALNSEIRIFEFIPLEKTVGKDANELYRLYCSLIEGEYLPGAPMEKFWRYNGKSDVSMAVLGLRRSVLGIDTDVMFRSLVTKRMDFAEFMHEYERVAEGKDLGFNLLSDNLFLELNSWWRKILTHFGYELNLFRGITIDDLYNKKDHSILRPCYKHIVKALTEKGMLF